MITIGCWIVIRTKSNTDLREVVLLVPGGGDLEDVPLDGEVELGEVDPDVDDVRPTHLVHVLQVKLKRKVEVSGQSW